MLLAILAMQAMNTSNQAIFLTDDLDIQLTNGNLTALKTKTGHDYLAPNQKAPLLSLRIKGKIVTPDSMSWDAPTRTLSLSYIGSTTAEIKVLSKKTHLTFELKNLKPKKDVELVIWGPYPTTIKESIGETVGVVRSNDFALGIQALNPKTLGGYPNTEDDVEPSYDIFATSNLADISHDVAQKEVYRGDTARATDFGSVLQAYTRDRSKTRIIENWGHPHYVAPAYKDGGVINSKIALFGCPTPKALERLGQIEIAEKLPHPLIDGVWGKISKDATASYLIVPFGEKNLDDSIALTKQAGLRYLYTDGCFENWGHFKLNAERFPNGWASMKTCVERAKAQGVRLGVHTLSNFITTNDPYVTPVPDKRLAQVGTSKLASDLDAGSTTVAIDDPTYFNQMSNNTLKTVRVGDELIQYKSVTTSAPWQLVDCTRGAFGTKATLHPKGAEIGKLMDHGYQVFLTNTELSLEVAKTVARLFNETGLQQLSFDGLEGNWSTGMGQYARILFTKAWYDDLRPELKGQVINDASNPGHYSWHIYTRMNWGEPWYAGFRESQTQYRLMNQRYYTRNLMPRMLGWFNMTPETSLEDTEWLLARAAGYDAGFCLCTSPETVNANGDGEAMMKAIRTWETARMAGAFSEEQKARMQKLENEFSLTQTGKDAWSMVQIYSKKDRLPVSGSVDVPVDNPFIAQWIWLIVQVPAGTTLTDMRLTYGGQVMEFPEVIEGPCALRVRPGMEAKLVDGHWKFVRNLAMSGKTIECPKGRNTIRCSGKISGEKPTEVKVEIRLLGPAERVTAKNL